MVENAWTCDTCGLDVHTPRDRVDPPVGWRVVEIFGEVDGAEPEHHHYCSATCVSIEGVPPDVREQRRRERAIDQARALVAWVDRTRDADEEPDAD